MLVNLNKCGSSNNKDCHNLFSCCSNPSLFGLLLTHMWMASEKKKKLTSHMVFSGSFISFWEMYSLQLPNRWNTNRTNRTQRLHTYVCIKFNWTIHLWMIYIEIACFVNEFQNEQRKHTSWSHTESYWQNHSFKVLRVNRVY